MISTIAASRSPLHRVHCAATSSARIELQKAVATARLPRLSPEKMPTAQVISDNSASCSDRPALRSNNTLQESGQPHRQSGRARIANVKPLKSLSRSPRQG
jgi:hypothetical protein